VSDDFSRWYAGMSFGEEGGDAEKRLVTVKALIKEATAQTFEALTCLAFRIKTQMSAPRVAEIRSALTGELPPPGDEELSLLAGASLALAMESDEGNGPLAAIMVANATCGGLRTLAQPMDLVGISDRAGIRFAEASRRRPSMKATKAPPRGLDKTEVEAALKLVSDGNPAAGIQALVSSIDKVFSAAARRQTMAENEFQKYTQLQDEELDILWWLEGGYCADLQKNFDDLPAEHRPLGISRELATLTKVLPGPTAVHSLFLRAGVKEAPRCSIEDAVQGMPDGWLDLALNDIEQEAVSPVTTPILFAMSRRKELDGDEGWVPAWSKLTSLEQGVQVEPLRLAEMAYREFLLVQIGLRFHE
jgi:hypothetical protein